MFNQNGGVTAFTISGNTVSTANGLYSHDAWHHFQVDFNFSNQTYRTFVDGNLVTFGASLTDVPFRTSGLNRIAEYGFQGSFNEATTQTQNSTFSITTVRRPCPSRRRCCLAAALDRRLGGSPPQAGLNAGKKNAALTRNRQGGVAF